MFHRSGFDGNNMSTLSLGKCSHGNFGATNGFVTNEVGQLIPECMFGNNHVAFLCNDARYGNLTLGVLVEGLSADTTKLPVNVNGAKSEHGAGATLVICGGWESGVSDSTFICATYLIRSGFRENHCQAILLKGEDKWTFHSNGEGSLCVESPGKSLFAVYHNRGQNLECSPSQHGTAKAFHTQALNGVESTEILRNANSANGVLLVLCSNTSGKEDASCAALYMLSIAGGKLQPILVGEIKGSTYQHADGDQWKFELFGGSVCAVGPSGPCRYAFISNLPANGAKESNQEGCLATGEDERVRGAVTISNEAVTGWTSKRCTVLVKDNEKVLFVFASDQLVQECEKFAFHRKWTDDEKSIGLHLMRVYVLRKLVKGTSYS